jgi:hypothetical protein
MFGRRNVVAVTSIVYEWLFNMAFALTTRYVYYMLTGGQLDPNAA